MRACFRIASKPDNNTRISGQICSIAATPSGKQIYIGTSNGMLLEYRLVDHSLSKPSSTLPLSERLGDQQGSNGVGSHSLQLVARKTVGKSSLQSIVILLEARRIAVLTEGTVVLLDFDSLATLSLPNVKGARCIAASSSTHLASSSSSSSTSSCVSSLAVLVKKKVLLFQVRAGASAGGVVTTMGGPPLQVGEVACPDLDRELADIASSSSSSSSPSKSGGGLAAALSMASNSTSRQRHPLHQQGSKNRQPHFTLVWRSGHLLLATPGRFLHAHLPLPPSLSSSSAPSAIFSSGGFSSSGGIKAVFAEIISLPEPNPEAEGSSANGGWSGRRPGASLKLLPASNHVVLVVDQVGLVTDLQGQPVGNSIHFKSPALCLAQSSFYVLSASSEGQLEVYDRTSGSRVQSLQLPFPPNTQPLLADDDEGRCILAASHDQVVVLVGVGLESQVQSLLQEKDFQGAVSLTTQAATLCPLTRPPLSWIETVKAEAAFLLISDLEFQKAVGFLLECKNFQPGEIFPFFPDLAKQWLGVVHPKRYWGLHAPPQDLQVTIREVLRSRRIRRRGQQGSKEGGSVRRTSGEHAVLTSEQEEREVHSMLTLAKRCFAFYLSRVRRSAIMEGLSADHQVGVDTLLAQLLLGTGAVRELQHLLTSFHSCHVTQLLGELESLGRHHCCALVLVSAGREREAVELWARLARGELREDQEEEEEKEVADPSPHTPPNPPLPPVYHWDMNANTTNAATSTTTITANTTGEVIVEDWDHVATVAAGTGASAGAAGTGAGASAGAGAEGGGTQKDMAAVGLVEVCKVLCRTADMDLMLENLPWILDLAPERGLPILTSTTRPAPLHPHPILSLLRGRGLGSGGLLREFLEHQVGFTLGDNRTHRDADRHKTSSASDTQFVMRDDEKVEGTTQPHVTDEKKTEGRTQQQGLGSSTAGKTGFGVGSGREEDRRPLEGSEDESLHTELALCLLKEVRSGSGAASSSSSSSSSSYSASSSSPRARLLSFLRRSCRYDAELMRSAMEGTDLWEEQVEVYGRLRMHRPALEVLVLQLQAYERAEQYCRDCQQSPGKSGGSRPDSESCSAFMTLLDLYLRPPHGHPPLFQQATNLLSAPGAHIHPMQVVETLAAEMPLHLAVVPLQRILREHTHTCRETQLNRNLHKAQYQRVTEIRTRARLQNVTMTEQRVCANCHSRLCRADGRDLRYFAVYPNGSLVCFKCFQTSGSSVCPATQRDFKVFPAAPHGEFSTQSNLT